MFTLTLIHKDKKDGNIIVDKVQDEDIVRVLAQFQIILAQTLIKIKDREKDDLMFKSMSLTNDDDIPF